MGASLQQPLGRWHIAGAGRIGTLAACYLVRAGADVTVVRPGRAHVRRVRLCFDSKNKTADEMLRLPVRPPADCPDISRLVVACKTPYTAAAVNRLHLCADATVIRLQNGMGCMDGWLGPGQRLIQAVTASAVMDGADGSLRVVAENTTTFGGGEPPPWFDLLAQHWPDLMWAENIRPAQWRKLIANAAINPLTAIYDVPNGALLERPELKNRMSVLINEADELLARLDPNWPGRSYDRVASVALATAGNTSSMRADIRSGARTEIDAINGWLLRQAAEIGMDLPAHRQVVKQVHALEPL